MKTSGNTTESCWLSDCNFTKNELLYRYFSRILTANLRSPIFQTTLPNNCFCRGVFGTLSRWSFFVNIMNDLKQLTIVTKKLHLRCFTRFCVHLCSEVTSSIYQTYKFKVYCNSFWRHCNVFDVIFACIKETLSLLSNVRLIWKSWAFVQFYVCYKYNNNLYHVSKEDVKMVVLFRCCLFHKNIIGFTVGFIITLLVSYVWKVCNETMLPFVDSIYLCSLFTRHQQSISTNNHFNFFLSVRFNELL